MMNVTFPAYKQVSSDMRIKNLGLTFAVYEGHDPTIYIDGGYIGRFNIGSVNNEMEYLDNTLYEFSPTGVNQFGIADVVSIQIVSDANRKGNEEFASIFDFIAHSGCSIEYVSFDLIDMGCPDPEQTIKHYDFSVDWEDDPKVGYTCNKNQKVGMDQRGSLFLVVNEKYDLADVFYDKHFIDMPDVIECDDKYGPYFFPLSAILNPNKLRVLCLDASWHWHDGEEYEEGSWQETLTLTLHIGKGTIKLSEHCMEQLGHYIIASKLLNAINCCLGGSTYQENESLYEDNIIDIKGPDDIYSGNIVFDMENSFNRRYGCKNSLDVIVSFGSRLRPTVINFTEFIPELIAEIQENLDFWSESNEEHKEVLVHLMNRMMELFENKIGLN